MNWNILMIYKPISQPAEGKTSSCYYSSTETKYSLLGHINSLGDKRHF